MASDVVNDQASYRASDVATFRKALRGLVSILCSLTVLACAGFAVRPAFAQAQGLDLTVDVSGLRNYKGRVVLYLWPDSEDAKKFPDPGKVQFRDEHGSDRSCDFSKATLCRRTIDSVQNLTVTYVFHGLQPGDYAVFVYHDENGNGILDRGLFGRPLEARGYSNLLPDDINPISEKIGFNRARFTLAESKTLTIGVRHPPRL